MKHVLILLAMMIILWGCAQKSVDEGEFTGTADFIQGYVEQNISADWLKNKPTGRIEVTGVEILKITPSKDDENQALVTAKLNGDTINPDSGTAKKFSITKKFMVTRNIHGYSVKMLSSVI